MNTTICPNHRGGISTPIKKAQTVTKGLSKKLSKDYNATAQKYHDKSRRESTEIVPLPAPAKFSGFNPLSASESTRGFVPFLASKSTRGFVPSVLSHSETEEALRGGGCVDFGHHKKSRFFLLSNNEISTNQPLKQEKGQTKKLRPKRTLNRKTVIKKPEIIHDGKTYKINARKSGVYSEIMHKALEQFNICEEKWGRVLVVRFDLHPRFKSGDNSKLSKFIKNLRRRIERKYGFSDVGYVWARECERSKKHHYHFALFLDGDKVRHSKKVLELARSTWKGLHIDNHMPVIPKPYCFVDSPESKEQAIYRISYLAKTRGKGYRDRQAKDYSTSRLVRGFKL